MILEVHVLVLSHLLHIFRYAHIRQNQKEMNFILSNFDNTGTPNFGTVYSKPFSRTGLLYVQLESYFN